MVASSGYPKPGDFNCVTAEVAGFETNGVWEQKWDSGNGIYEYGYKVQSRDLWSRYQKLPFFSIGQYADFNQA